MTRTIRYGDEPSQFVEVHGAEPVHGTAFVLHGGFWRARHDLHQLDALCADLATAGWLTVNIEYRRTEGDGGAWPQTLDDVLAAIAAARADAASAGGVSTPAGLAAAESAAAGSTSAASTAAEPAAAEPTAADATPPAAAGAALPTVAIGHSAGGHLALLAAARAGLSAAVGLAPLTDLPRSSAEGLGEGATDLFLTAPDPEASPLTCLPLGLPQLIVHGDADVRVPVEHSRAYVAAARAAGDPVDYLELPGLSHFQVTDLEGEAWPHVRAWLASST
ncbi:alpha/beta hydrolase family protein [Amycolatopsis saalfeldensis]|uniref:Alpha/beta hydrolase family protein n=1 Tax=Amycolatopsis saalfeldensis TaxID=394193 RepID=A0A1H8Q1I4_9PSEU|nr:prolyl oligopeptidase family serine peptidase [Amycolatopsis saalfeldensis]SEO48060.1 Alpha/beta hydrolase family protein [Amycolatopsis saalfeldensis]